MHCMGPPFHRLQMSGIVKVQSFVDRMKTQCPPRGTPFCSGAIAVFSPGHASWRFLVLPLHAYGSAWNRIPLDLPITLDPSITNVGDKAGRELSTDEGTHTGNDRGEDRRDKIARLRRQKTLDPRLKMSRMTEGKKQIPFLRQTQDRRVARNDNDGIKKDIGRARGRQGRLG